MTVEQELALMQKSLATPIIPENTSEPAAKANDALQTLKQNIDSLKAIDPSFLVTCSKIVDTVEIANTTNQRVEALADVIESLRTENMRLLADISKLQASFRGLEDAVKTQDVWFANFKLKSAGALQALEQYLRTHY